MTTKQKQHLLAYLGYYEDDVDGIFGAKSTAATKEFQADYGITPDGIFGEQTEKRILQVIGTGELPEVDWDTVKYFKRSEFKCKCGGKHCGGFPAEPDKRLVAVADRVREHFGKAVNVNSGVRCEAHNKAVGGVSNSRHLSGKAMDFKISGKTAAEILEYVKQQPEIRYAYAINSRSVHMDVN